MAVRNIMSEWKSSRFEYNTRKDPLFIGRHTNALAEENAYTWQIEVFKYNDQHILEDSRTFLWSWDDRTSLVWW